MNEIFEQDLNETIIIKDNNNELLQKYIGDIRNLRKLDTEMINNISKMSIENIVKIINSYNDITDAFCKFIENFK
jgi:hypothetical protein